MTRRCGLALLAASVPLLVGARPAGAAAEQRRPQAATILATVSPDLVERLHERKVVLLPSEPGQEQFVSALVIFDQPRSRVMRLLAQTARQQEFRPELDGVETLEKTQDGVVDEHRLKILFVRIQYRLRNHFDYEQSRMWWELDPRFESSVRDLRGFWELYELEQERTLGRFGSRVDLGPALPSWLQDYATRKNVPATVDNIRRWIDSGGTYRP